MSGSPLDHASDDPLDHDSDDDTDIIDLFRRETSRVDGTFWTSLSKKDHSRLVFILRSFPSATLTANGVL